MTVLLSSHNGEKYLRQALDSMAGQTFSDWEWILVDNASNDGTAAIMDSYVATFPGRVQVLRNDRKLDLADSLNVGLRRARGRYVARMDDDDLSQPDRLAAQVSAMDQDPELMLVGTLARRLHEDSGVMEDYGSMLHPVRLKIALCWFNPFIHTSIMMRRVAHNGRCVSYPTAYSYAEDYGMWAELARLGRIRILPQRLITYRKRGGGMTGTGRALQLESTQKVSAWYSKVFTAVSSWTDATPEAMREALEEPSMPTALRIAHVREVFRAAGRTLGTTHAEQQAAFRDWAEAFLDQLAWSHLLKVEAIRLACACGGAAGLYVLRRAARRMGVRSVASGRRPFAEEGRP